MLLRAAIAAVDHNYNLKTQQVEAFALLDEIVPEAKAMFQARNKNGSLAYELVCNRAGTKW